MNKLKLGKLRRCRNSLIANDCVYIGTGGFSAQHQAASVEQGIARQRFCCALRHENVEAHGFAGGLNSRGNVNGIADSRIIEPGLGTHIPDARYSGVYSNSNADLLLGPEAKGVRGVEMGQSLSHG